MLEEESDSDTDSGGTMEMRMRSPKRGWKFRIHSRSRNRDKFGGSVMNQQETDWIPKLHYTMKKKHRQSIPAFSFRCEGDSITLL